MCCDKICCCKLLVLVMLVDPSKARRVRGVEVTWSIQLVILRGTVRLD